MADRRNMHHFRHDWIIDGDRISKVEGLIHIGERMDIEIRSEMITSEEGFKTERFFVRVPSVELFLKFREETKRIGFDAWVETSSEEFQKLVQYQGYELPSLKDTPIYFLLQGYSLPSRLNRYLEQRWAEATPTYDMFDWIPMTPVTQDFVVNMLSQTDFCLGCDTRIGAVHEVTNGLYAQSILVRVLMPSEVDMYKSRIRDIIQTENWVTVSKEEYEMAKKVREDSLTDFVEDINKLAKANSDLGSNKNGEVT